MLYLTKKEFMIKEKTVVTLGNFDGLHKGHLKLVEATKDYADSHNLKSVVFSFRPHPVSVITGKDVTTIFSWEEKAAIMEITGVNIFVDYPFDKELAEITPQEFVVHILKEKMNCQAVIVGEDYTFGKNRSGTYETLKNIGKAEGIEVMALSQMYFEGKKIGSSYIRECIANSNFTEACHLMGRPYLIMGTIASGKKIGRTIGFPTVNIQPYSNKLLPGYGVYVTKTLLEGKMLASITNIGNNPTVNGKYVTVETHIFNFDEDVYSKKATIYFYLKIREEKKFNSLDELKSRIAEDRKYGWNFWNTHKKLLTMKYN